MSAPALDSASQTAARRDLIVVCAGALLFWAMSIVLELHERVVVWTAPWERYELDELPGVLLFVSVALAWYSWRRAREARAELHRRIVVEARLAETLSENSRLSLSHVRLQEAERKQLARELHDELGQHLNAIKIDAVSIRNWSEGRLHEAHAAARGIVQATDHVHGIVRDMLQRLRPVGLDELGLSAALEHLVQHWRARHPAMRVTLNIRGDIDDRDERENITLYRMVQEGLTNAVKHAHAREVCITLARAADAVRLAVSDDGVGASAWQAGGGLGLVGMRERVQALGGSFAVVTHRGGGFSIQAVIPVAPALVEQAA